MARGGGEPPGGSAANTVAGVASLGGRAAFIGKVADDPLGEVFAHDIRAIGADFDTAPLTGGPATGRCLINVTPDGERTMCTFLGAGVRADRRRRRRPSAHRGRGDPLSGGLSLRSRRRRGAPSPRPPAWPAAPGG